MPRALILGGTGLVGRATALRLLGSGWQVDVVGRNPAHMPPELTDVGGKFIAADRADQGQTQAALGAGADLLVDCLCFTAADARSLLPLAANSVATVVISSRAVYVDAEGNHVNSDVPPHFATPITEAQPTLPPTTDIDYRSREGYGANKVAAEQVVLESGLPVSVLRASQIHGIGASPAREWAVVKRVLDGRTALLLARRGVGGVHTTAAANLAALIETVAHRPGTRVLNSADPDAPSALEICRTIAGHLGHEWEEVLLDDTAPAGLGRTPWDSPHPIVLDTSAATALGYRPAGTYAATIAPALDWLVDAARDGQPPSDADYFAEYFDYAAEDAFLAKRVGRLGR
ncbi:NAD-dependent epimerase/dehydratase family protein [Streptomyces sp. NBC_01239]|uniref:NAD-dependent epimerase/dehydratase family protein n=1 Tax=Streptomyces sp. NBC_01239 TaxID=2903792 RepID=UPI0022567E6C|nr:NAD-dependent epimerase/dehydratase family protein [Streptomyces sp. NBC_01239]MCX4811218.1 NAD-dependent epimerase/dehydratase family protein [Streptomyces sp. NBC_01239]